jgi:amicyanin
MTKLLARLALAAAISIPLTMTPARAADSNVRIANFTFNPPQITVKAGTTVTWTNEDDIPHTVTSTMQAFKSSALDTDQRYSFRFTTPGTYRYFCSLHPHMTGTIIVETATGRNSSQ